jgi:outer membrane protein assembly factor BamB
MDEKNEEKNSNGESFMNYKLVKKAIITLLLTTLLLNVVTMAITTLSVSGAEQIETLSYISVNPNPIGVNQTLLVNLWMTPSIPSGPVFNFTVTFTKPDGSQDIVNIDSEPWGTAAAWFEYVPDQVGVWEYQFVFPGQVFPPQNVSAYTGSGVSLWEGGDYKASQSPVLTFNVTSEPVPGVAPVALPTDYWERPIREENKEWSTIAGDWVQAGYDAGSSRFNPYSQGPESPHILWNKQVEIGGIIGGNYGSLTYGGGSVTPYGRTNIIFYGYTYYRDQVGATHCINVKTGEELWVNPTMATLSGVIYQQKRLTPLEYQPFLVSIGSSYIKYDPWTGQQVYRLNGTLGGTLDGSTQNPLVYSISGGRLICWNTTEAPIAPNTVFGFNASATSFSQLIKYNVSAPGFAISYISGKYGGTIANSPAMSGCIDLETGKVLWNRTLSAEERETGSICAGDGKLFASGDGAKVRAYSMATGEKLWEAKADYPWGTFWSYSGMSYGYGNVYASSYDGLYCFDGETGEREWVFKTAASGYESPYPGWAMWGGAVIADGKVYQSTGEHSPSDPVPIGNRLYCIDAYTGQQIWNISDLSGATTGDPKTIADGVLLHCDEYDLQMYAIGKGKSAITVSAPLTAATLGQSVMITGSVTDLSPAQPGTPCVSPESMGAWMGYLHMQKPMPTNVTGVQVSLDAVGPDGSSIHIGTVTSDGLTGMYQIMWQPENTGEYKIYATFAGDASYGSCVAATPVGIVAAPAASSVSTPISFDAVNNTMVTMTICVGIAIIIAVAVATVLILRKRP